ncbi:hypothetical protein Tco_1100148 [Tanacetum coccineum]
MAIVYESKAFEIIRSLKINLMDIEAALPQEAFRPSRGGSDKLRAWRSFLKSAQSIYEQIRGCLGLLTKLPIFLMADDGVRGWMADFGEGLPIDACIYSAML